MNLPLHHMFIVLPMILQMLTVPLFYRSLLGGDPANAIRLAGTCLLAAAAATCFIGATSKARPQPALGDS